MSNMIIGMMNKIGLRRRVEAAASKLGASDAAITKWRYRGIPFAWRVKLVECGRPRFKLSDFNALAPVDKAAPQSDAHQ